MFKIKPQLPGSDSSITLLSVAATGVLLFTFAAGVFVYNRTQALISSDQWVDHTRTVLSALQRASLLVERIEYRSKLFSLTHQQEELVNTRSNATQLQAQAVRMADLVADNADQETNVRNLTACADELAQSINKLTPESGTLDDPIQRCRQTIAIMTSHEQQLLSDRTAGSQRTSLTSITTQLGFAGALLAILTVLFAFLFRDAFRRQKVGKEMTLTNEQLAMTVSALRDRARESELMTAARDELQLCVELEQVYQSAAKHFERLLAGTAGALCMFDNSRQAVEVASTWETNGEKSSIADFHPPEGCCSLRSGQPRWRRPGISEIDCTHFNGPAPERYLCRPIVAQGNTIGVLHVQCPTDIHVDLVNDRIDSLRQLLQITGMTIAAHKLRTRLENQSIRDSLTDLFNRHFMQISLDRELAIAARRKQTLAVFMLDVDHFKTFNDTHGHAAGDTVLKGVAAALRSAVRGEDILCRYGGEEFTIILPDITTAVAYARAEAIRAAVANLLIPGGHTVFRNLSISIGVAFYPTDADSADLLLHRADEALYIAKRSGRNRVQVFEAPVPVA